MNKAINYILLMLTAVTLIGLQLKVIGWLLFIIGIILLFFSGKQFRKDILLIYFSVGLLGITPISTDISFIHILQMGSLLFLAVAIPYLVSRFINQGCSGQ